MHDSSITIISFCLTIVVSTNIIRFSSFLLVHLQSISFRRNSILIIRKHCLSCSRSLSLSQFFFSSYCISSEDSLFHDSLPSNLPSLDELTCPPAHSLDSNLSSSFHFFLILSIQLRSVIFRYFLGSVFESTFHSWLRDLYYRHVESFIITFLRFNLSWLTSWFSRSVDFFTSRTWFFHLSYASQSCPYFCSRHLGLPLSFFFFFFFFPLVPQSSSTSKYSQTISSSRFFFFPNHTS